MQRYNINRIFTNKKFYLLILFIFLGFEFIKLGYTNFDFETFIIINLIKELGLSILGAIILLFLIDLYDPMRK